MNTETINICTKHMAGVDSILKYKNIDCVVCYLEEKIENLEIGNKDYEEESIGLNLMIDEVREENENLKNKIKELKMELAVNNVLRGILKDDK